MRDWMGTTYPVRYSCRLFFATVMPGRLGAGGRSRKTLRVHFFAEPLQLIIPPPAVTTRTAISPDAGTGKG